MKQILQKTFGRLSKTYYFRQLVFGSIFAAIMFYILSQGNQELRVDNVIFVLISTVLYPYSRFVYESIVNFVMGDTVFFVNALFLLIIKYLTMMLCWVFALFIAPIGLLYLYWYHSKHAN